MQTRLKITRYIRCYLAVERCLAIGVKRSTRLSFHSPSVLLSRQLSACEKYKYICRPVCRDKITFRCVTLFAKQMIGSNSTPRCTFDDVSNCLLNRIAFSSIAFAASRLSAGKYRSSMEFSTVWPNEQCPVDFAFRICGRAFESDLFCPNLPSKNNTR